MSGLDVEIVFWLENLSTLDAALIAGVVSGLIIIFSQWYFRRIIHNFKADVERYSRLDKVAKGDWPEHIRQSARNKLRKKSTKDIVQTVLMFLFWGGLIFLSYNKYSSWSEKNDEEIRKLLVEKIERIESHKSSLNLRTLKTPVSVIEAAEANEIEIYKWEYICSRRAENEGNIKGYDDIDRISIISNSFEACMLEQGWLTEQCPENENDCIKLLYFENECTFLTRKWLEDQSAVSDSLLNHFCDI